MKRRVASLPSEPAAASRPGTLGALCAAWLLLLAAVVVLCAGTCAIDVAISILTDGALAAALVLAAAMLGEPLVRLCHADQTQGGGTPRSLRFATAAGLGLGVWGLWALALGLCGVLGRHTAMAPPAAGVAIWLIRQARLGDANARVDRAFSTARSRLAAPAGAWWLALAAAPFAAFAVTGVSIMPGYLWKPFDPHPYDVMAYHLQIPREWYEAGRISPLGHNVYCFFPFHMEMHYLLAMHLRGGPWAGMYLAQWMSLAHMTLAVAAVYGLARSAVGADPAAPARGRAAAVAAAVLAASVPWLAMLGCVAYVEGGLLLYATLALAWMLHALRGGRRRCFAVAGLMAGLACGTKYTAVPMVLALVPLAVAGCEAARRLRVGRARAGARTLTRADGAARLAAGLGIFLLAGAAAMAPWLVRNAVWTGNPVFPLAMRYLGRAHFDTVQMERFERAHRAPADRSAVGARVMTFVRRVALDWQYGFVLLPAAAVAAVFARRAPFMPLLGTAALLQVVFWLFFTHLEPRFAVTLVPVAAAMVGAALRDRPRAACCAAVLAAASGAACLAPRLAPMAARARQGLYGLRDPGELTPELRGIQKPDSRLAHIGGCQPFFDTVHASRLRYRTIFDIRFAPGVNVLDAWLGESLASLARDHIVVIHPAEIMRLSQTYWQVPPLGDDWRARVRAVYGDVPPLYPPEGDGPVVYPPLR